MIAILSKVTYQLRLPSTWYIHNAFYVSLLSLYYKMAVYGANYLEVVPDLIDREPEWKMEAVLDSR
jgi:hypothetical protein